MYSTPTASSNLLVRHTALLRRLSSHSAHSTHFPFSNRFLEVPIIKKVDKMLNREQKERSQSEIICIDDLVPKNHLLRKIDETVDFTKIYDIVGKLYSANQGRPSAEPVGCLRRQ